MASQFPWLYPYVLETRGDEHPLGVEILRPVVEARLVGPGGDGQKVAALVDSGCSHILSFDWMALEIGVALDESREMFIQVGGASRRVRFADVTMRLCPPERPGSHTTDEPCGPGAGLEWTTEVGFIVGWSNPPWLMLLGQRGFFDQFTIVMNRYSQALALEPFDHFDNQYGHLIGP
jgi:hypothetical protein